MGFNFTGYSRRQQVTHISGYNEKTWPLKGDDNVDDDDDDT